MDGTRKMSPENWSLAQQQGCHWLALLKSNFTGVVKVKAHVGWFQEKVKGKKVENEIEMESSK
jgi:hypothetical protein